MADFRHKLTHYRKPDAAAVTEALWVTEIAHAPTPTRGDRGPAVLLAIGHGSVDVYQGIVPVLVPFLVAERHYDYVAVSGFVLAATVLSSVVQPLFGLLTDRWAMRWLIPVSMLVTGLGVALLGVSGSYWLSLTAIALSGVGVAAYHPEGARLARSVTGGEPVRMSWFSLGGNVGFALAPVIATPVLAVWGLSGAPVLIVPALLGIAVSVPLLGRASAPRAASAGRAGADDWPAFRVLTSVIVLRSVAFVGLSTFLGLFVQQRVHNSPTSSAVALFALFAGGAVGTVLGGRLAARWGRLRVLRAAYAAAAVALTGVVLVPGPGVLVFVAAAALTLYMPFSLHITLGQDYLPRRIGTASGVTLGLAVSAGGVFAPVLGMLAQATSLRITLASLILLPALACLLARRLREPAVP
ncbi:MAG: transporter, family, fosmidomycin resistance protein [Pseudonocardiales bacterium]|jgi:FSR family fosmidomycin resistance protein-like MFS transporter|nr:transporter, family, fosmidomycin resistance protein [Pseudonocardiales bacterium]